MKKMLALLLAMVLIIAPLSVSAADTAFFIEAGDEIIDQYMQATEDRIAMIVDSSSNINAAEGATTYYVSSSRGNDNNSGTSEDAPWKTISKLNSYTGFKAGDVVKFKRGDEWRFDGSLTARSGVSYTAYGSGDKPLFICSLDASGADSWELTSTPNVYKYLGEVGGLSDNIGSIVFNGGEAWGIHVADDAEGNRTNNGPVFNGIEAYDTPEGEAFRGVNSLQGNLEFWHDCDNKVLYLYSTKGNPGELFEEIELVDNEAAILLETKTYSTADEVIGQKTYAHDIIIDNIDIFGACFGVSGQSVKNVTVQYCVFRWIGGCIQGTKVSDEVDYSHARYGNAVESFGACDNFVIQYNYASQVYDCAWTAQHLGCRVFNDLVICGNVAEFANTGPEVWQNATGNSTGDIVITNMKIYDNYNRYMGYGFSHNRPGDGPHGGAFYGGWMYTSSEGSAAPTTFENNDVYNNVTLFSSSSTGNTRFISPKVYNFHDNVYMMEEGTKYGKLDPWTDAKVYMYTAEDIATVLTKGDTGSVFYCTEASPLGNMYDLYIPYGRSATLLGDVDGDGVVNSVDLIKVSRRLANWTGYEDVKNANADVDGDGTFTLKDGIILARHWAGWISYKNLPYTK